RSTMRLSSASSQGAISVRETTHKQVTISWLDRQSEVDEELAPLILALWHADLDTCNSCQENFPGITWIEFTTPEDAMQFLDLVADYPKGRRSRRTLYSRIVGCGSDGDWQYDIHPHNWGVEQDVVGDKVVETCIGLPDFDFSVSIRFPK